MGYNDAHVSFHALQPSMYAPALDLLLTTDSDQLVVIWCVPRANTGRSPGAEGIGCWCFGHVGRLAPTTGTSLVRGSVRDSRPCTALCPHNSIGAMQLSCCMAMAHL